MLESILFVFRVLCFSAVLCVIRVYLRYFVIVWDVFEEFGLCLRVFWLCFVGV